MTEDRDMKQNAAFLVAALKASNLKEGFPSGSVVKNSPDKAGDPSSIPVGLHRVRHDRSDSAAAVFSNAVLPDRQEAV